MLTNEPAIRHFDWCFSTRTTAPPYTSDRGYYRHGILGAIRVFDTRTNIRAAVSVIVQVANGRANICGRLVTCVELSLTEQVT